MLSGMIMGDRSPLCHVFRFIGAPERLAPGSP